MADGLVLSLFPGIGMLDRGFEEEGYCVVRGPDVLWGGDIRSFHPPARVFRPTGSTTSHGRCRPSGR